MGYKYDPKVRSRVIFLNQIYSNPLFIFYFIHPMPAHNIIHLIEKYRSSRSIITWSGFMYSAKQMKLLKPNGKYNIQEHALSKNLTYNIIYGVHFRITKLL